MKNIPLFYNDFRSFDVFVLKITQNQLKNKKFRTKLKEMIDYRNLQFSVLHFIYLYGKRNASEIILKCKYPFIDIYPFKLQLKF